MSQGRSPSGVASLRARFEHNQQDSNTSPPSRGRSPAGSVASDGLRPLSKVRTSFVAVEPSEHMASTLEVPSLDGAEASKVAPTAENQSGREENAEHHDPGPLNMNGHLAEPTTDTSDTNPEKPVSAAEEKAPGMLSADPKDEAAVSGGIALAEKAQDLGSILKGSPFEGEETVENLVQENTAPRPQSSEQQSKTSEGAPVAANVEAHSPKAISQPAKAQIAAGVAGSKPLQQPKQQASPKIAPTLNGKPKVTQVDKTEVKPRTDPPSAIRKRAAPIVAKPTRTTTTADAPTKLSPAKVPSSEVTTAAKDTNKPPEAAKKAIRKASDRL
ncbi:MAG: hypothetical protein Q9217_001935, partial [Psora testacea]